MNDLITIDDVVVRLDSSGRYCLNDLHKAAIANGKATDAHAPGQFLRNDGVQAFVSALDQEKGDVQKSTSVHSVKGGKSQGTYAVELIAIRYAAWIDPAFEIRVYRTFQQAIKNKDNWMLSRHATASSSNVCNAIIQSMLDEAGKVAETHHFSNEARLVNWALCDKFCSVIRDDLTKSELDALVKVQAYNAVLIGKGLSYEQRKPILKQYTTDRGLKIIQDKQPVALEAAV